MLVGELRQVRGSDFEAVDTSSLMRDPDSGAAGAPADWAAAEYYHAGLEHYFFTAGPTEQANIDAGSAGAGWARTGAPPFRVWSSPANGTSPVCRFYGNWLLGSDGRRLGPNSHFWTIDPGECEAVKRDVGWYYEGTAFHARRTENGACAAPLRPLYRAYNNGFPLKDSNHRYSTELAILESMRSQGWSVEGVAMCVE